MRHFCQADGGELPGYPILMRSFWIFFFAGCVWSPRGGCLFAEFGESSVGVAPGIGRFDTGFGETGESCDATLEGSFPENGATDVYIGSPIIFTLSAPDATAAIEANIEGTTTVSDDGLQILFQPDSLEPESSYSVSLATCADYHTVEFETSAIGKDLEVPAKSLGWTFNLQEGRVQDPTSAWLQVVLGSMRMGMGEDEVVILGAEGGESQNWCAPTGALPLDPIALPEVAGSGIAASTGLAEGGAIMLQDLSLKGVISPDGTVAVVSLSAAVPADQLAERRPDLGPSGAAICATIRAKLGDCSTCTDGQLCIPFFFGEISGTATTPPSAVPGWNCTNCTSGPPAPDATCE